MAQHLSFPDDPHEILDPAIRWFPAGEALLTTSFEKLLPPQVPALRMEVKACRGAAPTGSRVLSRPGNVTKKESSP